MCIEICFAGACFRSKLPRVYWLGYLPRSVFRERVSGASSSVCTGWSTYPGAYSGACFRSKLPRVYRPLLQARISMYCVLPKISIPHPWKGFFPRHHPRPRPPPPPPTVWTFQLSFKHFFNVLVLKSTHQDIPIPSVRGGRRGGMDIFWDCTFQIIRYEWTDLRKRTEVENVM